MNRMYTFLLCGILGSVFLGIASFVYAAEPQFLVSWKPLVYTPRWYGGKAIPVKDSLVSVSFELIDQNDSNKGKIISIGSSEVRWYIGTKLIQKGIGLQTITIQNNLFSGDTINVKIAVDFLDSKTQEKYFVEKYIRIPVTDRKLFLVRRWMDTTLAPRAQATWYAVPLFFSSDPKSATINWTVNGQEVVPLSDNPFAFTIQAGNAGQTADIEVSLKNNDSLWENANAFERVYVR